VRVIEAQHYVRADDGTVSIYLSDRSEGIDIQTHISRCVIDRVDAHPDYDDAFTGLFDGTPIEWSGDDDQEEDDGRSELVTDGGRSIGAPVTRRNPDRRDRGNQHFCEIRGKMVYCSRLECPFCGDGNDDQDDGDGDQEDSDDGCGCACCEMGDERAYDVPSSEEFTEMMDTVTESGITEGDLVEYDGEEYRVRGWLLDTLIIDVHGDGRHEYIDPDDVEVVHDDRGEIVSDGGQVIEPGDYVEHDGDRHRVARVGESHCEIYQLGSVSEIVPISDVIAVPEVPA